MADNVTLNSGTGGAVARTKDRTGVETQIVGLDINPTGAEVLGFGTAAYGLAVEVTRLGASATAALTNVSSSATSATALASNANRIGMAFINDADKPCYLKYGTTASATSFTRKLFPGEQWEPATNYTGKVDAIWDTGPTGSLRVTEMTT
jgi:hypothetical protein